MHWFSQTVRNILKVKNAPGGNPLRPEELYYSVLYSRGVYRRTGSIEGRLAGKQGKSPILTNVFTGEMFFLRLAKRFYDSVPHREQHDFCQRILHAPAADAVLWPVDMVSLSTEQKKECTFSLNRPCYVPGDNFFPDTGPYAALFPLPTLPDWTDGEEMLRSLGPVSWKNKKVVDFAIQITDALNRLNQSGYYYHDFQLSRLLFSDLYGFRFDYSDLAYTEEELHFWKGPLLQIPEGRYYSMEFGDPAVSHPAVSPGRIFAPDQQSQNFSLCAMLFYLFFGRHPYDGQLVCGYADDNDWERYLKFRAWQRMPVFLFEPLQPGRKDSLCLFEEDKCLARLWRETPVPLRRLFTKTLCFDNAQRSRNTFGDQNPPPAEWLSCFRLLGWKR